MAEPDTSTAGDGGTMRSLEGSASPHEWTSDQMHGAVPLPVPSVEPSRTDIGVPYAGSGMTSPGGTPE